MASRSTNVAPRKSGLVGGAAAARAAAGAASGAAAGFILTVKFASPEIWMVMMGGVQSTGFSSILCFHFHIPVRGVESRLDRFGTEYADSLRRANLGG